MFEPERCYTVLDGSLLLAGQHPRQFPHLHTTWLCCRLSGLGSSAVRYQQLLSVGRLDRRPSAGVNRPHLYISVKFASVLDQGRT